MKNGWHHSDALQQGTSIAAPNRHGSALKCEGFCDIHSTRREDGEKLQLGLRGAVLAVASQSASCTRSSSSLCVSAFHLSCSAPGVMRVAGSPKGSPKAVDGLTAPCDSSRRRLKRNSRTEKSEAASEHGRTRDARIVEEAPTPLSGHRQGLLRSKACCAQARPHRFGPDDGRRYFGLLKRGALSLRKLETGRKPFCRFDDKCNERGCRCGRAGQNAPAVAVDFCRIWLKREDFRRLVYSNHSFGSENRAVSCLSLQAKGIGSIGWK
jgi:hypothetical protein